MSNTIGYDLEGFANSAVTTTVTTSVSSDIALYLPFDSDLNDDSTNSHTVTNSGSVAVSTSVKKYGAGSADIPAAADYLEISGSQFDFGSNDFTIEGWFYDDGSGGSRNVALDYRLSGGGYAGGGGETFGWFFYLNEGGNGKFFIGLEDESGNSANDLGLWPMLSSSSLAISTNTWTHYAITREGTTFRAFKDGSLIVTRTGVSAPNASSGGSAILRIGGGHDGSSSYGMAGYIDDLRIINGTALYTAAFTPPTSAVGLTADVTNTTVDQKFLSSVWDSDDVSEKMADGTWIRNDSTSGTNPAGVVVQGAGLEVEGHRWYVAPPPDSVTFKVWGAGGAGGYWNGGSAGNGGSGGFAKGTFDGTPGTTYNIVVGIGGTVGGGTGAPAATGGNGSAGIGNPGHKGGQGGGYSGVFEGPVSHSNAFIIAGGGGGGGSYDRSGEDESGGGGGGTTGLDAANPGPAHATGGGQSSGGIGGAPIGGSTDDGSALQGGDNYTEFGMGSGAGGGGYYGGGGGGVKGSTGDEETSGGGGGSGYVAPALTTDTANLQGVTGTAGSTTGQTTAINPTASSDPDYTGSYGKGGGYNSSGSPGYVVITDSSGTYTFTSPGTHTLP